MAATGFVGWIEKVGAEAGKGLKLTLEKILPDVVKAAQLAEPVVDLALPAVGTIYNTVVNALATSAQGFAALGASPTNDQLVTAALAQTESVLLPALEKAGLTGDQATQVATEYINAILSILSGPLSGSSAAPVSSAAPAVAAKPVLVTDPAPVSATVTAEPSPGAPA